MWYLNAGRTRSFSKLDDPAGNSSVGSEWFRPCQADVFFAAYAGGLCEQTGTATRQIAGAILGGCAIFLPGTLLLFFVHPFWARLQQAKWASRSLTRHQCRCRWTGKRGIRIDRTNLEWSKSAICFIALTLIFLAKKVPSSLYL